MISKVFNSVWIIFFLLLLLLLFLSSLKVIVSNIKHPHDIREGTLLGHRFVSGADDVGTNIHSILLNESRDTVFAGSNSVQSSGSKVKIRYRGRAGNILFEVDGERIRWKYDLWDILSPFLLFFSGFLMFALIRSLIVER